MSHDSYVRYGYFAEVKAMEEKNMDLLYDAAVCGKTANPLAQMSVNLTERDGESAQQINEIITRPKCDWTLSFAANEFRMLN